MDDVRSFSRRMRAFFRASMARCLHFSATPMGLERTARKGLMTHRLLVVMQDLDAFAGDQVDCLSGWGDNQSVKSFNIMTSAALESSFVSCCWSKPFCCVLISPKLQTISVQDLLACTHFVQILVDTFVMISPLVFYPSMGVYCIPCVGIINCYIRVEIDLAKILLDSPDSPETQSSWVWIYARPPKSPRYFHLCCSCIAALRNQIQVSSCSPSLTFNTF
jgi:hypothetical protein